MLHVVQAVIWGVAEKPQLFSDEAEARAAYAASAVKQWGQRYAAYCEHHGVSGDSFEAAQPFVKTIDVSEKSTINYWTFDPREAGLGGAQTGPGPEEFRQVAAGIGAVKEGLTRLLADVAHLAESCARTDVPPVEAVGGAAPAAPSPPAAPPEAAPEGDPATYATPEWKTFVGTIRRLCCGSRNQSDLLPRDDWRHDVYSSRTSLEYWDWVADRIAKYKEKAQDAGYAVREAPDAHGWYLFSDREGTPSEDRYDSEWDAWCAAGLHLEKA